MTGRASLTTQAGMEPVLEHALAWLGRTVGYDAARALAYDPLVMIPVSFAAGEHRRGRGDRRCVCGKRG